jgi:hypothetical protein
VTRRHNHGRRPEYSSRGGRAQQSRENHFPDLTGPFRAANQRIFDAVGHIRGLGTTVRRVAPIRQPRDEPRRTIANEIALPAARPRQLSDAFECSAGSVRSITEPDESVTESGNVPCLTISRSPCGTSPRRRRVHHSPVVRGPRCACASVRRWMVRWQASCGQIASQPRPHR